MKKTKFLVLVLAVAIMMVGAGYAVWQDSVQINGTVSTGNLNFTFRGPNHNPEEFDFEVGAGVATSIIEYSDDEEDAEGNNDIATITVGNLYPGAIGSASITLYNESTIPTKLMDIMPKNLFADGLDVDELTVELTVFVGDEEIVTIPDMFGVLNPQGLSEDGKKPYFPIWSYWPNPINPETNIRFDFTISMPRTAVNSELGTFRFDFEPTFAQFDATEREVLGLDAE